MWMLYVCQQVELFSTNLQDGNMEAMRQCRAAFIKRFAGLSFEPYQCSAGVCTISYGHTGHLPDEMPRSRRHSYHLEEAESLLEQVTQTAVSAVNALVSASMIPW
ncbi:MAG: hypothetical protein H9847_05890 [Candidatus Anaerobiospirillum pullicola]|uniref:Lysozyme n=1 Tax=Candidatus Anaerobiospirillum pullicola TaxID=2838451 RepID=A0A948TGF9_9GAMM|nr:hypothetical protein [Candidatus Anaerobiospirillum pullicola]